MKTIKTWLITIAVLLCGTTTLEAETVQIEGIWYILSDYIESNVVQVTSSTDGTKYAGTVIIPSTVEYNNKTYTVTGINVGAFKNCNELNSVTIPESVTSIYSDAFNGCSALTSVNMTNGVKKIWDRAFEDCSNLTSITIPEGVTSIGENAFSNCVRLASIEIAASVTTIGVKAFYGCSSLTNIVLPNNITRIEIGTFYGCLSLKSISFPQNLTFIGADAFRGCNKLASIDIPTKVTEIGSDAFSACMGLTAIDLPEGVIQINSGAFRYCENLLSIKLPSSLKYVLGSAFAGCSRLLDVYCYAKTIPNLNNSNVFENSNLENATLHVMTDMIEGYRAVSPWNQFSKIVSLGNIVSEISLIKSSATLVKGQTLLLTYTISPDNAEDKSVTWNSSNTAVATVDENGEVTAISVGTAIITVTANDGSGVSASCKITVEPACFTLTYLVDGKEYYKAVIEQGAEIQSIDIPTKEGHTFCGWENMPSTMPGEDVTVYAKFSPNNYTITFKANDEIVSSESLAYGTAIVVPEAPEVEDYAFVEWKDLLETVPAYDVEFTAVYNQVNMRIKDGIASFSQDVDVKFDKIYFTRTFTNTEWQALYVPFEIPVTEEFLADFEVADLNDIRQYDRDDDGVKDETVVEAFKVKSGATLAANYPYLIRAKEVGEKTITVEDATLYATEEKSIDCSSVREKFTFTGTYSRLSSEQLPQGEGYYALSGGVWQPVAADASLGAFRFYLKVDSRSGVNVAQGNAIRMRVIDENGNDEGTTGIDNSEFKNQNSELIFDLQGRRVENPTKGVYIVNGKKTIIK